MQDLEPGFIPGRNLYIGDAIGEFRPDFRIKFTLGNEFLPGFMQFGPEIFVAMFAARCAKDTGFIIETPGAFHFIQCGKKFT